MWVKLDITGVFREALRLIAKGEYNPCLRSLAGACVALIGHVAAIYKSKVLVLNWELFELTSDEL